MIHLKCSPEDIADYVLLPGDPKRAKLIAEEFLSNSKLISDFRGLDTYTGYYNKIRVSVVTTGMGCPSAAIVCEELIKLGATTLIRVGTCGAILKDIPIGSLIVPTSAIPLVGLLEEYDLKKFSPAPDFYTLKAIKEAGESLNKKLYLGMIATSDAFYSEMEQANYWSSKNVLCFEMECAGIFTISYLRGIRAGAILAATGNLLFKEQVLDNEVTSKAIRDEIEVSLRAIEILESQK